jgi:hypothetical protein
MKIATTALTCLDPQRQTDLRLRGPNGIDYVEVSEENYRITVYLFRSAPAEISIANVVIRGDANTTPVMVIDLQVCLVDDAERDDCLLLTLDRPGNASEYSVRLAALDQQGQPTDRPFENFDPLYAEAHFRFESSVVNLIDCKPAHTCRPEQMAAPEINYLAKDYGTFRQLILDRLSQTLPDWQEQHEADIGMVLIEILAYVADYLSYYQDAVATEAYLDTARQRISVRRHVRLIDYLMHDGCNARTWVQIQASEDVIAPPLSAENISILAAYNGPSPPDGKVFSFEDLAHMRDVNYMIFQPMAQGGLPFYASHNEINFYTWGDALCCLAAGSTRATLRDQPANSSANLATERILHLQPGDFLLFEEVIGPGTGSPYDADPAHRHVVRLTKVDHSHDTLYEVNLIEIEWSIEDALPFSLCLSVIGAPSDCSYIPAVSVARGNLFLAEQGTPVTQEQLGSVPLVTSHQVCTGIGSGSEIEVDGGIFEPVLQQTPLTFRVPLEEQSAATNYLVQDPRFAAPVITLTSIPGLPDGSGPLFSFDEYDTPGMLAERLDNPGDLQTDNLRNQFSGTPIKRAGQKSAKTSSMSPDVLKQQMKNLLRTWTPQRDLLHSSGEDFHFVVEMDDGGVAHLRFGDGECGRAPEAGESFAADYRIGNGSAGNVGLETMAQVVLTGMELNGETLTPRNPLAAQGGTEPESIDEVKLFAPGAFQQQLKRAITAEDYATLAQRNPKVQRAAAALQWTGIRYEVHLAIDPLGTEQVEPSLLEQIERDLSRYRRIGHDLVVVPPQYVPLDVAIQVDLHPKCARAQVLPVLHDVFSNQLLANGRRGFFHPDNLSFGTAIYLSALTAAAQMVQGVQSVTVLRFQRLFEDSNQELVSGVLAIAPLEVARLDNDPARPQNGRFLLELWGGR